MYVERWQELIALLDDICPMLKPLHKAGAVIIRTWAVANQNRYDGLLPVNIKVAIEAFNNVIVYLPSEWVTKCEHAIAFLQALNSRLNVNWIETEAGCLFWDYYWWGGGCHVEVEPPPPPPPPPPPVKVCSDHLSETACLTAGCYWWQNSCHDQPQPPPPVFECIDYTLAKACLNAGCYWWNDACHDQPEPPAPEKVCSDYTNQTACLTAGCYWYNNSCHDQPEKPPVGPTDPMKELANQIKEYCATLPLTIPVRRANCFILSGILQILSDFFEWQRRR